MWKSYVHRIFVYISILNTNKETYYTVYYIICIHIYIMFTFMLI